MDKIIVCLSQSGHCSDMWVSVSPEQFAQLRDIEKRHGYLWAAKGEQLNYVNNVIATCKVDKPKFKTLTLYE